MAPCSSSWSAHVILGALTAVYLLFFAVSVREIGGQILSFRLTVQEACLCAVDASGSSSAWFR